MAYLFDQKGYIVVQGDEDEVMMAALEAGAEDVRVSGEQFEVISAPSDLGAVREALITAGLEPESAGVTQLPSTTIELNERNANQVLRLVDALDDLDDVQEVYGNFDIPDDILATLAGVAAKPRSFQAAKPRSKNAATRGFAAWTSKR